MIKRLARRILPQWLWRRLRAWRMRRLLASFQPYIVEHLYSGVRLRVEIRDPLAAGWYDHDWENLQELDVLATGRLRPGARVFDLGAHQGIVALVLAQRVGSSGEVIAVEAFSHNAQACERNCELNDCRHLRVMAAAISNQSGELEIGYDLNAQFEHHKSSSQVLRVPAVTIDDLFDQYGPPDVLFIDIEGFECHALRGAARTLASQPDAFVEVHVGHGLEIAGGSVAEVLSYFPTSRYTLTAWTESDATRRAIQCEADCPTERFFLTAVGRGMTQSPFAPGDTNS